VLAAAQTGRQFAAARTIMGMSLYNVARELGIAHATLQRWETDASPLAPADALR
jgi:DNA-binding transcriptional regulator YiaG